MVWPKRKKKYREGETYRHDVPPLKPIEEVVTNRGLQAIKHLSYRICQDAGVQVVRGRHNRQYVYLGDVVKILRYLKEKYRPVHTFGFDRLSLTMWLTDADREWGNYKDGKKPKMQPGYTRRLELEIERIADLEQPARTIAATEFLRRFQSSLRLAMAAKQYLKDDGVMAGVLEEREKNAKYLVKRLRELQEHYRPD